MNRLAVSSPAVALFHGLADPMRLTIIRLLAEAERRVVDLTGELGLAQSTVSGHLACLRSAGLVDAHPHGRSTYYALTSTTELWSLLAAAEQLLDTSGDAVTLCPEHYRPEPVATCGVAVRGCVLHGTGTDPAADSHEPAAATGHARTSTATGHSSVSRQASQNSAGGH